MNLQKYIQLVGNHKLFRGMDREQLINVFSGSDYQLKGYKKGNILYLQDQGCTTLDLILAGNIVIQKIDARGNILTITQFGAGECFGGNLIFSDQNGYPMTISAADDCLILHIPKELVIDLCQSNQSFSIAFLQEVSNKAVILSTKLNNLTLKTIRQSIVDYLLSQYQVQQSLTIKLPITKKQWSEKLGVQRPSLSRELMKMKEDGLIDYHKNWILIKDPDLLD